MPAIVSPQPRSPSHSIHPKLLLSPPPFYVPDYPITRLRSPISLAEPHIRAAPSTPKPLLTPKRRRHKGSHVLRRRRPLSRVDCRFDAPRSPLPHLFDTLPWIAALESAPEHADPWDIADLSLLPPSPTGPGPVRRRESKPFTRSSLRVDDEHSEHLQRLPLFLLPSPPLWEGSSPQFSDTTATPPLSFSRSSTPAPPLSPLSLRPQTPQSRFDPSRVIFRNLMPISFDPRQDGSDCIHNDL